MDKRELIGFTLEDIKELELIVKGMYEMDKIPKVMQELAIGKVHNILDKFSRLEIDSLKKEEIVEFIEKQEETDNSPKEEKPEEKEVEQAIPQTEEIVSEQTQELEQPEEKKNTVVTNEGATVQENTAFSPKEEIPEGGETEQATPQAEEIVSEQTQTTEQPEEKKDTIVVSEKTTVQERTTNEKFKTPVPSINEVVVTGKRVESRFVQTLRKAINLNDKYRYQRELFGGNAELMNSVIDKLDEMKSLEEVLGYVQKEFAWDSQSETVVDFYALLENRFS